MDQGRNLKAIAA